MERRPTLGRGLAELLAQRREAQPAANDSATANPSGQELLNLSLELLQPGRYQPRLDLRAESLQELAASIRAQGVVQPIVVRALAAPQTDGVRYEIIAGERRWRAAKLAGLTEIPALVRHLPDEAAIAVALIENIQRENLSALEEARALKRLITEFQLTHQQVAQAVGRSRAAVSNLLRLLELPPAVAGCLERRELDMGHARALLALADPAQQAQVATLVVAKQLSVRETEQFVVKLQRTGGVGGTPARSPPDPQVEELERALAEVLGAKVDIRQQGSGKSTLVVSFGDLEEIRALLARLSRD